MLHTFFMHLRQTIDLNVEQKLEPHPQPKNRSFADIYTELLDEIRKLIASQTAKIDIYSKPEVVDEPIQNQK